MINFCKSIFRFLNIKKYFLNNIYPINMLNFFFLKQEFYFILFFKILFRKTLEYFFSTLSFSAT